MEKHTPEKLAVTQTVAAEMISVSSRTVFNLRRDGKLASFKTGEGKRSKILIPVASIRAYIAGASTQAIGV